MSITFQSLELASPAEDTQVATDVVDNEHFQKIKITIGGNGVDDGCVSSANPLPVSGEISITGTPIVVQQSYSTVLSSSVTLSAAGTAYKLPSTELTNRKSILVYNSSDADLYVGSSLVTTSNGILINPGGYFCADIATGLYAVCDSAGKTIRVMEMA